MTVSELRDELEMLLDEMSDDDVILLYNTIAGDYNDENRIHYMSEFDDIINNWYNFTPSDLINHLGADFSLDDEYFTVDDHGDIYSFTDLLSAVSPWDRDAAIQYIIDFGENFGNPDIQTLLDRYDSEYDGPEMIQ